MAKGQTRYTQKCNNWPSGWIASDDVINLCKKNAPAGSEVIRAGTEVWAQWYKDEDCTYEPEKDNGCDIVKNSQRMTKKCNDWPVGWIASDDLANNYCNASPSKPPGSTAKKFETEVWAEWFIQNGCAYNDNRFIYNEPEKSECVLIGDKKNQTRYTKKCNNWPSGWVASNDIVNLCKKNAHEGSEVKIIGTEVWAEWYKDENCIKNNYFKYNEPTKENECDYKNNKQRMTKKCNVWPGGWIASNDLADNYCNVSNTKPEGSTAKMFGSEVWAEWWTENNCAFKDGNFAYNEPVKTECII